MMIQTDAGPIRLTAPAPEQCELTGNERAWIAVLREVCGRSIPPPSLAAVQAMRCVMRAQGTQ